MNLSLAGTVLIVFLQTKISLLSAAWPVYVGVLFVVMVMFAPMGIAGLIQMHAPLARAGRLGRLALPYVGILVFGVLALAGFVLIVELLSFISIGKAQGKQLGFFGHPVNSASALSWIAGVVLLVAGGAGLGWFGQRLRRVWDAEMEDLRAKGLVA